MTCREILLWGVRGEGECSWLPAPAAFSGACVEREQTGRGLGDTCDLENPCHKDLACVDVGESSARCVQDCWVEGGVGCAFAETCVDLDEGIYPGRGVCLPEGLSPPKLFERAVITGPPPPVNYGPPGGLVSNGTDFYILELKPVDEEGCTSSSGKFQWALVFAFFCLKVAGRVIRGREEQL